MTERMDIVPYLKLMVEKNASDLFISVGAPVNIKIEGVSRAIGDQPLTPKQAKELAYGVMDDNQSRDFEANMEMNLALAVKDVDLGA